MPAKEKSFVPFRLLSPLHPEFTAVCAAHKPNGERCTSTLPGHISLIDELHATLQESYETPIAAETREQLLREFARLTICGHQKKSSETLKAAADQWNSELESQDLEPVGLETPLRNVNTQSNNNRESAKFQFTPYQTKIDKLITDELFRKLDRVMDYRISQKSIGYDWKNKRDYLYIFECEEAKDMCKLGRTSDLSRRASEHEKCYPNLTQRSCLYCPNSKIFERVIQIECTQHRYKHKCLRCNTTHTEWFNIDLENLYQRVKVWSKFSQGLQSPEKRCQVSIPLFTSSDPDRWYKWAHRWVQSWGTEVPDSEPNTSSKSVAVSATGTGKDQDLNDDAESVPGLSPSSSAPEMTDNDYSDPPTPTPIERSRNGKPVLGQGLIIPDVSLSVSSEVYWTPVESMAIPRGRVLFPRIPGAYPVSPVKAVAKETDEDENGLADILGNIKLS
ncbi:hypothetical protein BDV36DRAFT_311366 [Aspergillus pseudocaelatus]|uniref:Bacteriophage T5 Orf172 DNA-binding domain-containing protein n=1 Tax=Aspergillus pseudocaelatus TaxID=1825620 RepID=A0ABQ6WYT6_9EURO|nr:hypothetical protein BDV36DRAFT_311366 [Aspergillus pseudocaelatus]